MLARSVSDLHAHREHRGRPKAAPRPLSVRVRRRAGRMRRRVARARKALRDWIARRGYTGVERAPRWPYGRVGVLIFRALIWFGALLFIAVVLRAFWVVVVRGGQWGFPFNVDKRCVQIGYSCGVASAVSAGRTWGARSWRRASLCRLPARSSATWLAATRSVT